MRAEVAMSEPSKSAIERATLITLNNPEYLARVWRWRQTVNTSLGNSAGARLTVICLAKYSKSEFDDCAFYVCLRFVNCFIIKTEHEAKGRP